MCFLLPTVLQTRLKESEHSVPLVTMTVSDRTTGYKVSQKKREWILGTLFQGSRLPFLLAYVWWRYDLRPAGIHSVKTANEATQKNQAVRCLKKVLYTQYHVLITAPWKYCENILLKGCHLAPENIFLLQYFSLLEIAPPSTWSSFFSSGTSYCHLLPTLMYHSQ